MAVVNIPCFVGEGCIKVFGVDTDNKVHFDMQISPDCGNIVACLPNGLFVPSPPPIITARTVMGGVSAGPASVPPLVDPGPTPSAQVQGVMVSWTNTTCAPAIVRAYVQPTPDWWMYQALEANRMELNVGASVSLTGFGTIFSGTPVKSLVSGGQYGYAYNEIQPLGSWRSEPFTVPVGQSASITAYILYLNPGGATTPWYSANMISIPPIEYGIESA